MPERRGPSPGARLSYYVMFANQPTATVPRYISIYFPSLSTNILQDEEHQNLKKITQSLTYFFLVNRWSRLNTNSSSNVTGSRTVRIWTSDGELADRRTDPSSWRLFTTQRSSTFRSTSCRLGNEVITTRAVA